MAKYNTFVVYDCKNRKNKLVTSSARKAKENLKTGIKIEIWNENAHIETLYSKQIKNLNKYILEEKAYVGRKQEKATSRNNKHKNKGAFKNEQIND